MNNLITSKELASHLRITKRTLQEWREAQRIPFLRLSAKCFRYDLAKVMEALKTLGK